MLVQASSRGGWARDGVSPFRLGDKKGGGMEENSQNCVLLTATLAVFYKGEGTVHRPEEALGHAASVTFTNLFLSVIIPAAAPLSFTVNTSDGASVLM